MRSDTMTRARLMVLAALGAFAVLVPTASADTSLPVWTCRASAAYAEVSPLLDPQRIRAGAGQRLSQSAEPRSRRLRRL